MKEKCSPEAAAELVSTACPTCGYEPPDDLTNPAEGLRYGLDICDNCGEFLAFEETPAPLRLGGPAIEAVAARSKDFARLSAKGTDRILDRQALIHRAARKRGYHLGKLKLRSGRA